MRLLARHAYCGSILCSLCVMALLNIESQAGVVSIHWLHGIDMPSVNADDFGMAERLRSMGVVA